ncbi:MAG: hypothetical protein U0931_33195 [Vulcanimicrobiota bacterium]
MTMSPYCLLARIQEAKPIPFRLTPAAEAVRQASTPVRATSSDTNAIDQAREAVASVCRLSLAAYHQRETTCPVYLKALQGALLLMAERARDAAQFIGEQLAAHQAERRR